MEHNHIFNTDSPLPSHDGEHACGLEYVRVAYYSLLLCLGLPANILTVIILSRLVARRQKSSYNYLLALAAADILVLFFIVFLDFLLEDFMLGRQLPHILDKIIGVLEFSSNHTSIWITVPLTIDSKRFRTMAAGTLKAFIKCQKQPVHFYTNHNFSITSSPWISPANSHCIKMLVYQYDKDGKPLKISP
ncbi:hypothetical protein chiPu_0013912 [Chiloscyllium punctatum]|uniref:G-protein coupled receptors family 1 profile domain-containing protein n=1 Tax=Chiloscyllium punctatum TaxID=137246 RepID=A0A401SYF3_CHIPU|nr:hypothetical protein [Chiloscyllium punctatum]